jgi:beta-lactamase superfamily II metal-dependent hydrolase
LARTSKKKPVAKKSAAARRGTSRTTPAAATHQAKIRMYRQGLGDCFLISLPRTGTGNRPYYVMIDCGVILGTADPGTIMTKVIENIVEVTGGEIDLLIATHEHWDHLSGFVQAKQSFDKLRVQEVWLGWTEDPKDELTQKLKKEKGLALAALRMGLSHLQLAGDSDTATELGGILEFFGAARGAATGDALDNVRGKTTKPRYCLPSDAPVRPSGVGARFYVLGPPHDEKQLRKINPSARDRETYGLALDGFPMFMDGAGTALGDADSGRPFDQQYEIPFAYARGAPELEFFRQHYWQPDGAAADQWRRIDIDWLGGSSELALQLDSLTNNTSLVVAIELPSSDVLLFAADAQVGNWLSWQQLSWTVDGKTVTGPDLLKRAIVYKVGHHGSHNATLKNLGLEQMQRLRVAMIPVDQEMAKKKRWNHMPLDELVTALNERAKGVVLRVDQPMPATQEQVVEDPLFFEVTL